MANTLRGVLGVVFATLCSCAYTDPGTGTNTLEAILNLAYDANGSGQTLATVTVSRGGVQVSNPNVFVTDTVTAQNFGITQGQTTYINGYHRRIQVRVISGADNLNCELEGPSPHTVTQPLQTQTHLSGQDLQVAWQTPDGVRADAVTVSTQLANTTNTLPSDNGSFTIDSGLLRPGAETVSVTRRTQVIPAGGVGASLVQMSYKVSVGFTVQ